MEDVAEYTCIAENVRTSTELELEGEEEKVELLLSEVRTDVTVKKGEEVTFSTPFAKTMAKKPIVQWFFNSAEVRTSERVSCSLKVFPFPHRYILYYPWITKYCTVLSAYCTVI